MSDAVSGAITAHRVGRPVLVADAHDRKNEADVILVAETTSTPNGSLTIPANDLRTTVRPADYWAHGDSRYGRWSRTIRIRRTYLHRQCRRPQLCDHRNWCR